MKSKLNTQCLFQVGIKGKEMMNDSRQGTMSMAGRLFTALAVLLLSVAVFSEPRQDIDDIIHTATAFVKQHIPADYQLKSISSGFIDNRLQFRQCEQELTAFVSGQFRLNSRMTIGVRCRQPFWQVYIPIKLEILAPVVVARTTILKGETLRADQLEVVMEKLSGSHQRLFRTLKEVAGKQARRTIRANQPITSGYLQPAYIVKRRQEVLIVAKNKYLQVKMKGIALKNGQYNDLIKVRNKRSNKIIEARVSGQGEVRVNF